MCDTVYTNPLANFNQWYTPYEKTKKTIVRLNTVILDKVKVQKINAVNLLYRASNKLQGDEIRSSSIYVFDDTK